MDHEKWRERVFGLRDGMPDGEERRAAEAHLASCPLCREEQANWRRLAGALFTPAAPPRTDIFVRKVMARLEEPAPSPFGWTRWLAFAAAPLLAAFWIALAPRQPEPELSIESLLLTEARPGPAMMLSKNAPDGEALLGTVWEDDL